MSMFRKMNAEYVVISRSSGLSKSEKADPHLELDERIAELDQREGRVERRVEDDHARSTFAPRGSITSRMTMRSAMRARDSVRSSTKRS